MSNEIRGVDTQIELSNDINVITAEVNAYQRVAGEAIFEIGRRLKHVKENDLAHGEFGTCHEEELDMTRDVAARLMKMADELGETFVVSGRHLGVKALYEIAQIPIEHRDQSHTVPSSGADKKPV